MNYINFPNRIVMGVPGLDVETARAVAINATRQARMFAPKLTVQSSSSFTPIYGEGWFGIAWNHPYIWFQEAGIKPFTMRSLAGKTIPMWVDDPDGTEASKQKNPKTRVTASGRRQTLIFRRAARIGQRKDVWRNVGGQMVKVNVPASYPGAPGRIAVNRSRGLIRQGDVNPGVGNPGQIAKGNVGVRWRHPGLHPSRFLARGVHYAAIQYGIPVGEVSYRGRISNASDPSFVRIVYVGE